MFWNVFTDVVDHIPQKRILRPWNQREAVCLHGTFKIRARAVRHVIAITRELPLGQWLTFINRANPRKNIPTCSGMGIPQICTIHQFRWEGQCVTEMKLLNNTAWSRCVLLTSTPECVVSPRGETTHSGVDVNNTHPSMINPLIQYPVKCKMKLFIHSQTSTAPPWMFGNG